MGRWLRLSINPRTVKMQSCPREDFLLLTPCFLNLKIGRKVRNFQEQMHFNLLRNSYPTVSTYADGYELLASGAFLTSGSVPKNEFFDTLSHRPWGGGSQIVKEVPQSSEVCMGLFPLSAIGRHDARLLGRLPPGSARCILGVCAAKRCRMRSRCRAAQRARAFPGDCPVPPTGPRVRAAARRGGQRRRSAAIDRQARPAAYPPKWGNARPTGSKASYLARYEPPPMGRWLRAFFNPVFWCNPAGAWETEPPPGRRPPPAGPQRPPDAPESERRAPRSSPAGPRSGLHSGQRQ